MLSREGGKAWGGAERGSLGHSAIAAVGSQGTLPATVGWSWLAINFTQPWLI